jgi:hypothetical protein
MRGGAHSGGRERAQLLARLRELALLLDEPLVHGRASMPELPLVALGVEHACEQRAVGLDVRAQQPTALRGRARERELERALLGAQLGGDDRVRELLERGRVQRALGALEGVAPRSRAGERGLDVLERVERVDRRTAAQPVKHCAAAALDRAQLVSPREDHRRRRKRHLEPIREARARDEGRGLGADRAAR